MRLVLYRLLLITAIAIANCLATPLDRFDIKISDDNSSSDQLNPRIALGADGEIIIIWYDKRGGQNNIYCQYLDSAGNLLGSNLQVNEADDGIPQFEPAISANSLGLTAAVWKDYRNGIYPFGADIYLSRVEQTQSYNDLNLTSEFPDSACESPDIALFGDGSGISVWADYRNRNWDIYGQRLTVAGGLAGSNFKINSDVTTSAQHSPRIASFSGGGFIAVWYDNRLGDDDIYARRYDRSLNPIGLDFKINDDNGDSRQAFPVVATDSYRRFYIAWVDWQNGQYPQNPDIYLRRFDSAGAPLGLSVKINLNDGQTAQREVALCSDNIGNLCLAWADSSAGQWDIRAQIIDNEGLFAGTAFNIHQDKNGRQLHPTVVSDNYKLVFAWSDARTGNFDIYVSLRQYNDPSLIIEPSLLTFSMEQNGENPAAETVVIRNAGPGSLRWNAIADADWINLNPNSGTTPDSIVVNITADGFSYGNYSSGIRFVNIDLSDSSFVMPVYLNVTAPLLRVSPDSLYFQVFAALGNPAPFYLKIDNVGTGILHWDATENISWVRLDKTAGAQSDSLGVSIDIDVLPYGRYREPIIFNSVEAVNSPETVYVILDLIGNMPYLSAQPDSFYFDDSTGGSLAGNCRIINLGTGGLQWTAATSEGWINLLNNSGIENDSIRFSLDDSFLPFGLHMGTITILDTNAFNRQIDVSVLIRIQPHDTLLLGSVNVVPGGNAVLRVDLVLSGPIIGACIPVSYDTNYVRFDSVSFAMSDLPSHTILSSALLPGGEIMMIGAPDSANPDYLIRSGNYHVADIFFTAGNNGGMTVIDTAFQDGAYFHLTDSAGDDIPSVIVPGVITIGGQTGIGGYPDEPLPMEYLLSPNFPNPFNAQTILEVALPRSGELRLEIFNILGQKISEIYVGTKGAGRYRFRWDGSFFGVSQASTGIYFCRMQANEFVQIRKILLIR